MIGGELRKVDEPLVVEKAPEVLVEPKLDNEPVDQAQPESIVDQSEDRPAIAEPAGVVPLESAQPPAEPVSTSFSSLQPEGPTLSLQGQVEEVMERMIATNE